MGRGSESSNALEAGESGDAVGALSLEAGGGRVVLVASTEGTLGEVAAMAVLDGCSRQGGEGGSGARGSTADKKQGARSVPCRGSSNATRRHCTTGLVGARGTHGISEGVSGLEPGGGRLIKVGGCVCAMVSVDWPREVMGDGGVANKGERECEAMSGNELIRRPQRLRQFGRARYINGQTEDAIGRR